MAVLKSRIGSSSVTFKLVAYWACSAATRFSPFLDGCGPCQAVWGGVSQRRMNSSAQPRSEEEKQSRKVAREETTAAHKDFPFLPTRCSRQVYVLDRGLADKVARIVIENQDDPSAPILETNPGPGILTKALLKAGAKRIVLTESLKGFMPYVKSLQKERQTHIAASYNVDYVSAWCRTGEPDSVSTQFETDICSLFPHKNWAQGPPVSVVAMVAEKKEWPFLNHVVLAFGRQQGLYSLGRPEWFLALSPNVYTKLLAVKMEQPPAAYYYPLAVVLHLLFDIRLCAQLPGWKFTPRFPEKRVRMVKQNKPEVSNSMRYLLHLRPLVDPPLECAQISPFYTFLTQLMRKKKLRIIPKMEQLVPGCGPYLIMLHISMMSLVADMSPHQFLTIFKALQTWPEYQGSPLQQLLTSGELHVVDYTSDDEAVATDSVESSGRKPATDLTTLGHRPS